MGDTTIDETATSSQALPTKLARTEAWQALRKPARQVIGERTSDAEAPAPTGDDHVETVEEDLTIGDLKDVDLEDVSQEPRQGEDLITWQYQLRGQAHH